MQNINNNFINPLMFQPNQNMNMQPMNFNMNQINQNLFQNNNIINYKIINVYFLNDITGEKYTIQCNNNEKFSKVINIYREKAKDFDDNFFLFNAKQLNPFSNLTLTQLGISNCMTITVAKNLNVIGSKKI